MRPEFQFFSFFRSKHFIEIQLLNRFCAPRKTSAPLFSLLDARSDKSSLLLGNTANQKEKNMTRKAATKTRPGRSNALLPAALVLVASLLLLLLAAVSAAAFGQLSVSLEPLKDSPEPNTAKYLASAVSDGWGEPPLGPGAVTFTFEASSGSSAAVRASSSSAGDVHLGLAQATLLLPCGSRGKVKASFTPSGAKEATSFGAKAVEVAGC